MGNDQNGWRGAFLAAAILAAPLYAIAQPAPPPDVPVDDDGTDDSAGETGSAATGSATAAGSGSATPTQPTTAPAAGRPEATAQGSGAAAVPVIVPTVPPPTESRLTLAGLLSGAASTVVMGLTQIDYGSYDRSLDELSAGTREPLNEDRFQVRRARLRLENEWKYAGYAAEVEFFARDNAARPVSFVVHAQLPGEAGQPPLVKVKAGLFPVPFTYQNLSQWAHEIFFAERALFVDGFVPGRFDLGVAASGHVWAFDWIVAAQNGQPIEAPNFAYTDPNSAKDYSGRIEVGGELVAGVHAASGVSFLTGTGFSAGTPPTKDTFVWRDLNEDGRVTLAELIPIPGAPARPSENFDRWGVAGDVRVWRDIPKLGQLRLDAELALASNLDRFVAPADPVLLGRDQRGLGFYASLTQYVTRHAQVGFRYDHYQPNIDDLELFDGRTVLTRRTFKTYTAGVSGRLKLSDYANARVHVEYAHQQNSLGRDAAGRPAQLDNGAARVRFEVVF